MKAEYIIGISILWFLIGYVIATLGAAPPDRERYRVPEAKRSAAPKNSRKAW